MDILESIEALYKLPECPFCGGAASPDYNWRHIWIDCGSCGAKGPKFGRTDWIKAVAAWTTRYAPPKPN